LRPFSAQINDSMVMERAFAVICSMFGVLALGLAAIGLYGVLSYMIARRRQEFGIRMALGASPADVRRMIYGQSFATCAAGTAIGCLLAVWASRFARAMLFGISGAEPRMYAVVVGVLAVVAFIATVVPAFRASRTEPMQVLRSE
jgi:ABC-type antimicrobial peptide transport system permease subunit